jgi:hypothetical protein
MAKNNITTIREFLEPSKFAFVGLSRDPKKFSRTAFKELSAKGYEMLPINPNMDDVDGVKCYHDLSELPQGIDRALFMTPKANTASAVDLAISQGIRYIWIQQGSESKEAVEAAKQGGAKLVYGACIMMHTSPSGVHRFHRFLSRLFGTFPKN